MPAGLNRKEAEIFSRLDPERLPHHIAIIMDGNGRWAKRRHLPRIAGHRSGVAAVRSTVEAAALASVFLRLRFIPSRRKTGSVPRAKSAT